MATFVNRNELRSPMEPWYRYTMRHWVRTRWVVHDLTLESSRQLRCDWYQEHIQWGTDIDQLSFAHIMAKRELERRMKYQEPDDHVKTLLDEHPTLSHLTDSHEWHALDQPQVEADPITWMIQLPEHIANFQEGKEATGQELLNSPSEELFVRIMSERVMAISRKRWSKWRKPKQTS